MPNRPHVHICVKDRVPGGVRKYVCRPEHAERAVEIEHEMGYAHVDINRSCILSCLGHAEPAVGKD